MIDLSKIFTKAPKAKGSFFLSIEGIEGSGKSSQMEAIKSYLESIGKKVILTREPGGTIFGELLRESILTSSVEISPVAEAHLFAAARAQHLFEKILPALLTPNTIVMADRFIDSSLAYQGSARKLGLETVLKLHENGPLNILPDVTFYFAIDYETSLERQNLRGSQKDYFEKNNKQFYLDLIEGYEKAFNLFSDRIKKIDATQSINDVKQGVLTILEKVCHGAF